MSNIPKPGAGLPAPKASAIAAKPVEKLEVEVVEKTEDTEKEVAVEALDKGYYGNIRRNVGDKFMCKSKLVSNVWMKRI